MKVLTKKRSACILSAGALLAGLLGGAIAAAPSAVAAASYECNTSKKLPTGSYYIRLPHQNYAPRRPVLVLPQIRELEQRSECTSVHAEQMLWGGTGGRR